MSESKMTRNPIVRYALVAAAVAAWPLASQGVWAQDDAAAPAADAAPADAAPADDAPADEAPADAAPADAPAAEADAPPADEATDKPDAKNDADAKDEAAPKDEPNAKPAAKEGDAAKDSPVLARAGDFVVTMADLEAFISTMPADQQPQIQAQLSTNPDAKKQVVVHLLNTKALAREGERVKLDREDKISRKLQIVRDQVLAGAMAEHLGTTNEAGDKAYFEAHKDDFGKVQARHILIATRNLDPNSKKKPLTDEQARKKAEEIRARLEKGEDFAKLAKAESDDPGSKDTGGSYTFGRVGRQNRMVPEFEKAAYALEVNEISPPVKTAYGYHVIQLQKRIPVTFEESRAQVGSERFDSKMKELLGGEVTFEEKAFRDSPAAGGTGEQPANRPAGKGAK